MNRLKKCTEYTYCGLKEKHPEYFSKLNSLKVELKKKKTTLKEIESQIKSMEDFSTSSEFSFVKNLTPRMYAANPLSPPQRFKHSLYQSAVRSVPQAQSRMDRSGGEPLPDVRRFLVHPCRFLVHRWISRLWLHLTA